MASTSNDLHDWVTGLVFWQQVAFDKILSGKPFEESDYDEVIKVLLKDRGLLLENYTYPTLNYIGKASKSGLEYESFKLLQIANMQNVNALVEGQRLTFGDSLTAIYGANGSGKSGYSRVLGCAGFSRGDTVVLGNIETKTNPEMPMSADIEIETVPGGDKAVLHYAVGDRLPQLSSLYVFDTTSVRVHLTKSNAVSFSPAGLSSLTTLAEVVDGVKSRLKTMCSSNLLTYAAGFLDWFDGESEVRNALIVLDTKGDLKTLKELSVVTKNDQDRLKAVDLEIAKLKAKDPKIEKTRLAGAIVDLSNLKNSITTLQTAINQKIVDEVRFARSDYEAKLTAAQKLSSANFQTDILRSAGGDEWYAFVKAAKDYSDIENASFTSYPSVDDICVLCQQPLSVEASQLLARMWEFLESDAKDQELAAAQKLSALKLVLDVVKLDFFNDQSVSFRLVMERNEPFGQQLDELLANYVKVRQALTRRASLEANPDEEIPEIKLISTEALETLIGALRTESDVIETLGPNSQLQLLESEHRTLSHRIILETKISQIEAAVAKRMWSRSIDQISCSTSKITQKYSQLFKQLISDRYIEVFQDFLRQLDRPLKVQVTTQGIKSKAFKRIVVQVDDSDKFGTDILDKVLSEGEKRAVAIADFLTEVTLDDNSGGIVLDDPVTSLDLEWRELIAEILVKQAARRQVIIFTHDLPFLYFLNDHADSNKIPIDTHWIKRGDSDNLPGYVYCNNSPTLEKFYKDAKYPREIYALAIAAAPQEQELLLKQGFAALRTCYETFIVSGLFKGVVQRFKEQISPGYLKDIVWDDSIVTEVNEKYGLLSRYVEGHSHSDAYAAVKPNCKLLMKEIECYENLKGQLKALKKSPLH